MKKYKCLTNNYYWLERGRVYHEDYTAQSGNIIIPIKQFVKNNPHGWQLVEEDLTFPREMWVRNYQEHSWLKYTIIAKNNDGYISCNKHNEVSFWNYGKEIPKLSLPIINGYEGKYSVNGNTVSYGCVTVDVDQLKELSRNQMLGNRKINSITLDSGVIITIDQINQIIKYVEG